MMSDVVLQILLLLAYLAIGLIAVTFPIYAICVSFLPQEKWESEKERKKRIERLQAKISELTSRLRTEQGASEQIKEEIAKSEAELKGTKLRVHCLTARGAVGLPVSYLALSLLMVGVGFYYFDLEYLVGVVVFGFISVFFSAMAVFRLYKTITAVEYAALRTARSIGFEVYFEREGMARQTEEMKLGRKSTLTVYAITTEGDVESFWMFLRFPSEFEILDAGDATITQRLEYCWVLLRDAFLPKNIASGLSLAIKPEKVGEYPIPVRIFGKGIYEVERELTIKVVK